MVSVELEAVAPLIAAGAALVFTAGAEVVHARRTARLASLAFGPDMRPAAWARTAPMLRVAAMTALAWSLVTLLNLEPRRWSAGDHHATLAKDPQHVLLVLDVSPSMRLVDAGPDKKRSRMQRAREVMESFFDRVPLEEYRVSVVAFYNGAKPVVVDTTDLEVVRNILGDLPMHFAFPAGKTKLFDGLEEAAKVAKPWNPRSTTLVVVSDGDTVPATGMPKMPESVRSVIVIGIGDPLVGKFIDGRNSRQDVPMLRQVAARLGGTFHNGNESHVASSLIGDALGIEDESVWEKLTRREYALIACALSALVLALLPLLLNLFGTRWRPGTHATRNRGRMRVDSSVAAGAS
ncbi:MAG: VWA domain-containing protein [Planctomycetes bacterium]|nr:VWA domain-containing protein [Planctomycetota bacterium]